MRCRNPMVFSTFHSNLLAREVLDPEQNTSHYERNPPYENDDNSQEDDRYEEETGFHYNEEPSRNQDEDSDYQDAQDPNE